MTPLPTARVLVALGLSLPAAALAAAAPASAYAPAQTEQVNRATGPYGAFTLNTGQPLSRPEAVTSDGRGSIFQEDPSPFSGEQPSSVPALPKGLYQRDIVTNRTKLIAGGDATWSGFDKSEHWSAFTTSQSLDPADTNGVRDLYATKDGARPVLLSRATGASGAALGVTNGAILARGATTALFETADGIFRRDLSSAKTTKVGAGTFIGERSSEYGTLTSVAPQSSFASADGSVFSTADSVVTKTRTIGTTGPDGELPTSGPLVSLTGDRAVFQYSRFSLKALRVVNTKTGALTAPTVPAQLLGTGNVEGFDGFLVRVSPDARVAIVDAFTITNGGADVRERLVAWNLDTGAVTELGLPNAFLSESLKYGITSGGGNGNALVVSAVAGQRLPGTIDLPSPNAYASLFDACGVDATGSPARVVTVGVNFRANLPKANTLRVRAYKANGTQVVDKTVAVPTALGFDPSLLVDMPVGSGAYKLKLTATFPGGVQKIEDGAHLARACVN